MRIETNALVQSLLEKGFSQKLRIENDNRQLGGALSKMARFEKYG